MVKKWNSFPRADFTMVRNTPIPNFFSLLCQNLIRHGWTLYLFEVIDDQSGNIVVKGRWFLTKGVFITTKLKYLSIPISISLSRSIKD